MIELCEAVQYAKNDNPRKLFWKAEGYGPNFT